MISKYTGGILTSIKTRTFSVSVRLYDVNITSLFKSTQ